MLFDKKEKYNNKIFYDLLNFSEIEFNIEKSTEVDKNIKTVIIKGSPSSNVKMYELKNIIIKYLNLLQHEIIRLEIGMNGKIQYENDVFSYGEFEVKLVTNKNYDKYKSYGSEFIDFTFK